MNGDNLLYVTAQAQDTNATPQGSKDDDASNCFGFGKDLQENFLLVSITKIKIERIWIPLRRTLIIKLLGKIVGFKFLEQKVTELWSCKGFF